MTFVASEHWSRTDTDSERKRSFNFRRTAIRLSESLIRALTSIILLIVDRILCGYFRISLRLAKETVCLHIIYTCIEQRKRNRNRNPQKYVTLYISRITKADQFDARITLPLFFLVHEYQRLWRRRILQAQKRRANLERALMLRVEQQEVLKRTQILLPFPFPFLTTAARYGCGAFAGTKT